MNKRPAVKGSLGAFASKSTGLFVSAVGGLLGLSYFITGGSWEFLYSTYGVHLMLPDLTPNVGLWWYFFIEMFDSFRDFFLCVFQLHLLIYVGGLCIRFRLVPVALTQKLDANIVRKQPLFVITTILGICAMFKSYPSIGDTALYLSLLSLYRHVFPRMSFNVQSTGALANSRSHAIHLLRNFNPPLCNPSWPRILPSLDLCGFWECKFFLCHHIGLVPCAHRDCRGRTVRGIAGRVGNGEARNERQGCGADIITAWTRSHISGVYCTILHTLLSFLAPVNSVFLAIPPLLQYSLPHFRPKNKEKDVICKLKKLLILEASNHCI